MELTDDVIAFLSEGTRTGKLGYVAADGRPLIVPVWFIVDGQTLVFNTDQNTAKSTGDAAGSTGHPLRR